MGGWKLLLVVQCFLLGFSSISISWGQELENVPAPLEQRGQPRSSSCTEKSSNGKTVLTCTGFSHIPLQTEYMPNFVEVKVLDMSTGGNTIQILQEGAFSEADLINLETVKLSDVQLLTIMEGAFLGLDLVLELDISRNRIEFLNMKVFENLPKLQILLINNNPKLHHLKGDSFPPLQSLRKIDLSHCQIQHVPEDAFKNLWSLQELHLEFNIIKRLDWKVFENLHVLNQVFLQENNWTCDCHIGFLQTFLSSMKLNIAPAITCNSPPHLSKSKLASVSSSELTCPPQIAALLININGEKEIQVDTDKGDLMFNAEPGKSIGFECVVEAYPESNIVWKKDGKLLNNDYTGSDLPEAEVEPTHYKITTQSSRGKNSDGNEPFQFRHSKLLTIYGVAVEDVGWYECFPNSNSVNGVQSVYLNLTEFPATTDFAIITGGGSKWWLWILLPVLVVLLLALIVVCILIWRRRENERQKRLKQAMMEKFKDSEIVVEDILQTPKKRDVIEPLLSQKEKEASQSALPDVAQNQGNGESKSPNLSPLVFSPRPPLTAEARRQFFADGGHSQTLERPSRPASAMSNAYYPLTSGNYGTLPMAHHGGPLLYNVAPGAGHYPMRKPWGSSQSLVHPTEFIQGRRPYITRQFSGPAYGSLRMPRERPPSISSTMTEPLHDPRFRPLQGYVTLPRTFQSPRMDAGYAQSVSPTESTNSTLSFYSTIPRRRFDPNSGGVIYDSVGPRTTADGGSNLSLNKIGDGGTQDTLHSINQGLMSPASGKIKAPRARSSSTTTPGSLRGRGEFFSFEPIQEVEGGEDLIAQLPSNAELDKLFPTFPKSPPPTLDSRYRKKKAPNMSSIPPRPNRKPIKKFDYSDMDQARREMEGFDASLDGDQDQDERNPLPELPTTPVPNVKSSIENIIEGTEGTEV